MKKHLVIALAVLFGSMALSAQMQVLKDAERAMKDGQDPQVVVEMITPAFTNPETAQLAQTYFIPGKAMFKQYDDLFAMKQFNKLPENGDLVMANDLLNGYGYYMTALPLDSVPNAKGKIKTKYSKEIISTICGHYMDYNSAAVAFWEAKEYFNAYRAWDVFFEIIKNPVFAKDINNAPADSILGEIYYNQALAAWQADSLEHSLNAFYNAKKVGYNKKQLYDYSLAVATNLKDAEAVKALAEEANALYGKEDPNYFGLIINYYLQKEDLATAHAVIDQAIANDPTIAQYYLVKGIIYDNQGEIDNALDMFRKAAELNSADSQILYNLGRGICNKAYALNDQAPTSPDEYNAYYESKIKPLFLEAAGYLEQAWQLDNDNVDALNYLENVYYNLKDEAKYQEIQARKL